jgi:hypothetical protein
MADNKEKKDTSEGVLDKIIIDFNKELNKPIVESKIFEKKVLIEKCINGREMSNRFIQRTKTWYPNIHKKLDSVESFMEEDIIALLRKVDISASKKINKHSLPYTNVVVSKLILESDVSAMFDYTRTYRAIVKELLEKGVFKIRFYVHLETYEDNSSRFAQMFSMCGVKYSFRYYIH